MRNGFTFIEVMAALIILSTSLVVLLGSQGRSMDLVSRARTLDFATTLASAKMSEVSEEATQKGISALKDEESGEFDQEKFPGFRWRYWTMKVPTPDFAGLIGAATGEDGKGSEGNAALFAGPLQSVAKVWGEALREVHVEVTWNDGPRSRGTEIVTHLIAPDAIGQIQGMVGGLGGGGGAPGGGQGTPGGPPR